MDPNFSFIFYSEWNLPGSETTKIGLNLGNFNVLKIKVPLKGGFVSVQYLRKNHTS